MKQIFDLVEEHYAIPSNFETDIRSYGPLSGTCFEERVVNAYDRGLLLSSSVKSKRKMKTKTKKEDNQQSVETTITDGAVLICSHCADLGHGRNDCLELI